MLVIGMGIIDNMIHVTQILEQIERGDPSSSDRLLPLIYEELKKLAAARMAVERTDHTLQATALVHEAYARLVGGDAQNHWDSRHHFFSAAAEAMRRILVEHARAKQACKRGGNCQRVALTGMGIDPTIPLDDFLDLHGALEQLEQTDARKAQIVKLRYFTGLSVAETARCLRISEATVLRDWRYARAWLRRAINSQNGDLAAN